MVIVIDSGCFDQKKNGSPWWKERDGWCSATMSVLAVEREGGREVADTHERGNAGDCGGERRRRKEGKKRKRKAFLDINFKKNRRCYLRLVCRRWKLWNMSCRSYLWFVKVYYIPNYFFHHVTLSFFLSTGITNKQKKLIILYPRIVCTHESRF